MMESTVGIDMAKDTFQVEVAIGEKRKRKSFCNTAEGFLAFLEWCASIGAHRLRVCMEATGRYGDALANFLYCRGQEVRVVNPKRARRFAESLGMLDKTDKVDAHGITEYALHHWDSIQPWVPKSSARQALQDLRCHIVGLQKAKTAMSNRSTSGINEPSVLDSLERIRDLLEEELEAAIKLADDLIEADEQLCQDKKVLKSQIGVGEVNATAMLTRIDFRSFKSARQVGRYVGLTPRREQSGTSINKRGRISKEGSSDLRGVLFMAARTALNHDPLTIEYAQRLRQKGKPQRVIEVAVMRKIVLRSWSLVTKSANYDLEYRNHLQLN